MMIRMTTFISTILLIVACTTPITANAAIVNQETNAQYTSIQDAINAADSGQTINVTGGTYHEKLIINKPITLQGIKSSEGMPVIESQLSTAKNTANTTHVYSRNPTQKPERDYVVLINENNVNMNGFKITSKTTTSGKIDYFAAIAERACVIITSSNVIVKNNVIDQCEKGILLTGGGDNSIQKNTITRNTVDGVALINTNKNHLTDNNINHNILGGITLASVMLPQLMPTNSKPTVEYNEILNNNVSDNGVGGIGLGLAGHNRIADNIINNNGGWKSPNTSKDQLVTAGQKGFGISLSCEAYDNIVENNQIINNNNNGILISHAKRNVIRNNDILSSEFGIQSFNADTNQFNDNLIKNNTSYGIIFQSLLSGKKR